MKKLLVIVAIFFGVSTLYANINAVVSILPQKTFLNAIGGDKVNVTLMVLPGNSPHSYEPKPSQMKDISKADLYFAIGVEFEHAWLPRFRTQNEKMQVVVVSDGVEKQPMKQYAHKHGNHEKHAGHKDDEHHENLDPHIWTSPLNVKIIAQNIYEALVKQDPANQPYYRANYEKFITHVDTTDTKIKALLANTPPGSKFMVFHPAWGYFARDYGLTQMAIEAGGKNPKPKQVMHLIEEAKKANVKAVFTAPEFSETTAKQIASEVGVPVIKVSPLNPKWSQNLQNLARAIAD